MTEDIILRRGEVVDIPVEADDETAQTVKFTASKSNVVTVNETESFELNEDTGKMNATIRIDTNNLALGDHEYTLTITYSDGTVDILPDPSDCEGDCSLPVMTICTSNDDSLVS